MYSESTQTSKILLFAKIIEGFLYLLKTSENLWFSDVFRGYRKMLTIFGKSSIFDVCLNSWILIRLLNLQANKSVNLDKVFNNNVKLLHYISYPLWVWIWMFFICHAEKNWLSAINWHTTVIFNQSCLFPCKNLISSFMGLPLSCRNQSIDLQSKIMDWFLYDRDLHHERVNSSLFTICSFHSVLLIYSGRYYINQYLRKPFWKEFKCCCMNNENRTLFTANHLLSDFFFFYSFLVYLIVQRYPLLIFPKHGLCYHINLRFFGTNQV